MTIVEKMRERYGKAAYAAYGLATTWGQLTEESREKWRKVADAVHSAGPQLPTRYAGTFPAIPIGFCQEVLGDYLNFPKVRP